MQRISEAVTGGKMLACCDAAVLISHVVLAEDLSLDEKLNAAEAELQGKTR